MERPQKLNNRTMFYGPAIPLQGGRNRYFCPRVHRRLTHDGHKGAAAQCPVLAGWLDKKRGHRCTCNQRNAGACPLRSECPPTRLANIGSFEKGWEDGDDSHPVTCRSKSEVWVRRQCPSAFQRPLSGQPSTSRDPSCGNVRVCALRIRVLFITALLLTVTLEAARKHVHPKAPATGAGHGTTAPWAGTEPS